MSAVQSEERRMLRESTQAFLAQRAPVSHLRERRDRCGGGFSPELWRAFGEQGYSAVLVPQAHGGLGLAVADAAMIAQQIGHTLAPSPFLSTAILAALLLTRAGSAAQQAQWLPRIAAADTVLSLAIDEGPRRGAEFRTRLVTHGSVVQLDGAKDFVIDGTVAQAFIVAAQGSAGLQLVLVPARMPGVHVESIVLVDSQIVAQVRFDAVCLGADALLDSAPVWPVLEHALDAARLVAGAEMLGIADEVFARTLDYLRQRRQFGRAIGEFQALQHRAAQLFCDLELTRALLTEAAEALDRGAPEAPLRVAQAKARAGWSALHAVQEGVQMHGGIGMTDELDLGLFMKRARVLAEWLGSASFHLDRAARMAGY